jgi:hypothetical protein
MTISDYIAEQLIARGVTRAFGLDNPFPSDSIDCIANCSSSNAEFFGNRLVRHAGLVKFAGMFDFGFVQLGVYMIVSERQAVFCFGVLDVVVWSSEKKMIRSNAFSVVAFVANEQTVRNRTIVQNPRVSVGLNILAAAVEMFAFADSESSISAGEIRCPFPAAVGFGDVGPEPSLHVGDHSFCPTRPASKSSFEVVAVDFSNRAALALAQESAFICFRLHSFKNCPESESRSELYDTFSHDALLWRCSESRAMRNRHRAARLFYGVAA